MGVANAFSTTQLRIEHYSQGYRQELYEKGKKYQPRSKKTRHLFALMAVSAILKILWIIWIFISETQCTYRTQELSFSSSTICKMTPSSTIKKQLWQNLFEKGCIFLKANQLIEEQDRIWGQIFKDNSKKTQKPEQRDLKYYRFTTSKLLLALLREKRKTNLKSLILYWLPRQHSIPSFKISQDLSTAAYI